MKKIITAFSLMFAGNAFAHVSQINQTQHANEHLLLAALLIPVALIIAREVSK